jgi:hypothetical protein
MRLMSPTTVPMPLILLAVDDPESCAFVELLENGVCDSDAPMPDGTPEFIE